jgi:predicted dehydrogenase
LRGLGALGAVADADPNRATATAENLRCAAMGFDQLLNDRAIAGIVLALPPHLNAEAALQVLGAGKHLLVEKPMALDLATGQAIVDAAAAAGVVAMTGHLLRFHPAFLALEALVRDGHLGKLRYIQSTRIGLGRFFSGADALWDIAPHDLSLILALTGALPSSVRLESSSVVGVGNDIAHLHLGFPTGVASHTFVSRIAPRRDRSLTVIGDSGMAVFDDLKPWPQKLALYPNQVWRDGDGVHFSAAEPQYVPVRETPPLEAELAHFMACIEGGIAPRSAVSEGLDVLRVLTAAEATPASVRTRPVVPQFLPQTEGRVS